MHLLVDGNVVKFDTAESIARHFCERRLVFYEMRIQSILGSVAERIAELMNRIKFINSICDGTLEISGVPIEEARARIIALNLIEPDLLLLIPIKNLTLERVQKLQSDLEAAERKQREYLETSPTALFTRELESLEI